MKGHGKHKDMNNFFILVQFIFREKTWQSTDTLTN